MLDERPGTRSMSRYAWMAPAVVLFALLLVYLFGDSGTGGVQTVAEGDGYLRLQLSEADPQQEIHAARALSSEKREHVLQNLSHFRAEHQMMGPVVTVASAGSFPGAIELARRTGALLARHNLGDYAAESTPSSDVTRATVDGILVEVRRADEAIARNLLAALSPILAGTATIRFYESLPAGRLRMTITGEPRFTGEGIAVFAMED